MYCSCANITLQKIARTKANLDRLLHSHATRPLAGQRKPPISTTPIVPRPPPSIDLQQPSFLRLSKFLRFPRDNAVSVRHIQPHDSLNLNPPLDSIMSVLNFYTKSHI
ncbi:hypothetical protein P692DRAFT_20837212 [Suillus brevipes Sb2]|nr:hypothetical protein P692DRAFT_20837212 [Suillus brevipes Sb2]